MSDTGNSATRQVLALGSRGWRWVLGSLSALVADLSASRNEASSWRAMALVGADGIRLIARRKGEIVEIARLGPAAPEFAAAVRGQLARAEQQALALRFTGERAIRQDLALPQGARPVIGAIIRNKIEGLAPWALEDTAWGYRLAEDSGNGPLTVAIGAIGRKTLAGLLTALAAAGIKPIEVDIADDAETADPIVIDHSSDARRQRVATMLQTAVAAVVLGVVSVGAYGAFLAWRDYAEATRIEARMDTLKRELTGKPDASTAVGMLAEANRLVERKTAERPVVAVLNDLTHAIPDGSWLTAIDLVDGQVTVQGRGGPAPELIQSIEKSEAFAAVNFASGTQHDDATDTDVYSITAAIEPQVTPQ
jgi:general secretion pathway protein L